MKHPAKASKDPTLTIYIPSYNYGQYLEASIDSVLSQNFTDFELLIVDDGSTDDSPQIAEAYAKKDPRIRFIRHEQNRGLFTITEEALKEVRGHYLHCFSADDLYLPDFLSKSMEILLNQPDVHLVCCDIEYFGAKTESKRLLPIKKPEFFPPEKLISLLTTTEFRVPGASCIVKSELCHRYGGFDQKLENISDWFLFHHIALFEGVAYIPETLISMRVHQNTYTNRVKRDKKRRRATYWHLLNKLSKRENQEIRDRFIDSNLLKFISRELSWRLLFNPRYWVFR